MKKEKIENFKQLKIWTESMNFVEEIYKLTSTFPKEELYGLSSQLRRAAISIPSNISEGFMRYSNKEFKKFLFIAISSCAELETQLILSNRLGYLHKNKMPWLSEKLDHLNRMMMSLIKKI